MSWSYDPTDLNTTTASGRLNTVRLLVGDTDTGDQQLQDEEITFSLSETGDSAYLAAAWSARAVASKYSRLVTTQLDGALRSDYSDLSKQYRTLADNLEYKGKTSGSSVGILAGGISKTRVKVVRDNTDRIEGSFRRDRFKNISSHDPSEYE